MVTSAMGTPTSITVKRVERLSPLAVRVTLDPGAHAKQWKNIPGGYLTFCLPCGDPILPRSYSLVQAPDFGCPQVIVKETRSARGSAFVNRQFKAGMELMAYPPKGRLFPKVWNETANHFVMFAAGTGITPLFSVLQHVMAAEPKHEVTLFYGNSSVQDILLREELEEWAKHPRVQVVHILTDGSLDDELHNGRITASKTMLLWDTVRTSLPRKALVSGPTSMKEGVLRGLDLCRVAPQDIRYEDFHHPPHLDAPILPKCEVTAEYRGETLSFSYRPHEESLIEAIVDRGLDAPYSCRGGICGHCRAEIKEGEVNVDHNYALTREEKNKGWVLCCQARPLSDKVHVSFKGDQ